MFKLFGLAAFTALALVIAGPSIDFEDFDDIQFASLPMAAIKAKASPAKAGVNGHAGTARAGRGATDAGIMHRAAARIAVQFGRQAPAQAMPVEAIADDAISMARLGLKARRALERQKCPGRHVQRAVMIAERYGAQLIDQRDLDGAVMCLKFNAGLYSSGFRNLFFVA